MKDSSHLGAWVQMHLPRDGTLRPMGIFWIPLQILGILEACLWRSTVERGGTTAPAAKSYGYSKPLTEPTEFNDSRQDIRRQLCVAHRT